MTENNQNQEAAVPSDGQQPQQSQAEPVKPMGAKLREAAERLQAAANQESGRVVAAADAPAPSEYVDDQGKQPEEPAGTPRDLPGLPSESKQEGDNHQPKESEKPMDDPWINASQALTSVFQNAMTAQQNHEQQMLNIRQMQVTKSIELIDAQNQILRDILGKLDEIAIAFGSFARALEPTQQG